MNLSKNKMYKRFATKFGQISEAAFSPNVMLQNPHLQTILPKFVITSPKIDFVNERIETPDQDFVDIAWAMPDISVTLKAVVIMFHGLEGSSQSHYIKHLISELRPLGFGCVVMHFRGCSGEPNLRPISYHSGATFDPDFIVPIVKARYNAVPLFAVGFSLGGNMLMKLMANSPSLPIEACVSISAPLDLAASSSAIQKGFSKVYQWHLMKSMKANLLHKMQLVDMSANIKITPSQISSLRTFEQFDEHITSILHDFAGAADYYAKASAIKSLSLISKPTLILHAQDDPFMDDKVIPTASMITRNIAYELSKYGGHVGFLNDVRGPQRMWLPQRITHFLSEFL